MQALLGQGTINQEQTNSLLTKLINAQAAITEGNLKEAYNKITAFTNEIQALMTGGVLTTEEGDPLLDAANLLLQSLKIGGGF